MVELWYVAVVNTQNGKCIAMDMEPGKNDLAEPLTEQQSVEASKKFSEKCNILEFNNMVDIYLQ